MNTEISQDTWIEVCIEAHLLKFEYLKGIQMESNNKIVPDTTVNGKGEPITSKKCWRKYGPHIGSFINILCSKFCNIWTDVFGALKKVFQV